MEGDSVDNEDELAGFVDISNSKAVYLWLCTGEAQDVCIQSALHSKSVLCSLPQQK